MLPLVHWCVSLIVIYLITSTNLVHTGRSNLIQEQDGTIDLAENTHADSTEDDASQLAADPEQIKRELKEVVSRYIDIDKDGQVSYEELKKYLAVLHKKNIEYNVDKQWTVYSPQIHEVFSWEGYEPEKKEVLTWDHYYNQTYPELVGVDVGIPLVREQDTASLLVAPEEDGADQGKTAQARKDKLAPGQQATTTSEGDDKDEDSHMKMLKLMVRRADARWKLADENGDTLLTKEEFKHLLHPDESHEGLQELFVSEATEDMDLNKDSKICLEEFMKHLQVLASDQERADKNWLSSQQENFGRFLDKNKDGVLDSDEIKNWLIPPKGAKFESEAKRLLDIGDSNQNHKISIGELLEQYEQFLSLLPAEYWAQASDSADNEEDLEATSMVMSDQGTRDEL